MCMKREKVAAFITENLKEKQMSDAELARLSGVSTSQISRIINMKTTASQDVLVAIARAFKKPPETIFRAAGLLSPVSEKHTKRDELIYLADNLSEEDLQEVIDYARHRLEKQEARTGIKKQTSRRRTPARNALIEQ